MDESNLRTIDSVLIVEDHRDAAEVLREVVEDRFKTQEITVARNFADGLRVLKRSRFSMALFDLGLPDGDGLELIKYCNQNTPECLAIVTTIFDDEEHLFEALRCGASGYLLKGHSASELGFYLEGAVSGRPALSPRIAQSMLKFFQQETLAIKTSKEDEIQEALTSRETEVLSLIAKGCGVKEVSGLLDISANTVSHHIKSIYSKLNIHNRAEATAAAVQLKIFNPA